MKKVKETVLFSAFVAEEAIEREKFKVFVFTVEAA
jgi:hypothetical protein